MERGSYVAASAGLAHLRKLDIVNNNLANVNTPGFKKELLVGSTQTFDQTLASIVAGADPYAQGDHARTPAVVSLQSITDFSPGPIKNTGNVLDLALRDAKDFFVINTPNGARYTRAGNFTLNETGEIVTVDGMPVQGDGGSITVSGSPLSVAPNGTVTAAGNQVGKFQVVRIENPNLLVRELGTRFALAPGQAAPANVEPEIEVGALEMSNVSAITSMIDLISASKGFEMYTRTAQSIDAMNQTAIGQVGRRQG